MVEPIFKKIKLLYILSLRSKKLLRRGDDAQLEKIDNHTSKVAQSKKTIFRLIVLLIVCLSIFPFINITGNSKFNFQTENEKSTDENPALAYDKPVIINPKYSGVDNYDRPFKLAAARGYTEDKVNVFLDEIDAKVTLKDATSINLKSKKGAYNIKEKQLNLTEGVVIELSNGYTVETTAATVKTDENMAVGVEPVTIKGKMGDLYSKGGFTIKNSGEQVQFHGGVKMLINADEAKIQSKK